MRALLGLFCQRGQCDTCPVTAARADRRCGPEFPCAAPRARIHRHKATRARLCVPVAILALGAAVARMNVSWRYRPSLVDPCCSPLRPGERLCAWHGGPGPRPRASYGVGYPAGHLPLDDQPPKMTCTGVSQSVSIVEHDLGGEDLRSFRWCNQYEKGARCCAIILPLPCILLRRISARLWPNSGPLRQNWTNVAKIWSNPAQHWPNLAGVGPNLAAPGPFVEASSDLVEVGLYVEFCPDLVDAGPNSVEFGTRSRSWPTLANIWPIFGPKWPNTTRFWSQSARWGKPWPISHENPQASTELANEWAILLSIFPELGQIWRNSVQTM